MKKTDLIIDTQLELEIKQLAKDFGISAKNKNLIQLQSEISEALKCLSDM